MGFTLNLTNFWSPYCCVFYNFCCKVFFLRNNCLFLLKIIHQTLEPEQMKRSSPIIAGIPLYWITFEVLNDGRSTSRDILILILKLWTTEHIPSKTHELWKVCPHGRINIGKGRVKYFNWNSIMSWRPSSEPQCYYWMLLIRADLLYVFD